MGRGGGREGGVTCIGERRTQNGKREMKIFVFKIKEVIWQADVRRKIGLQHTGGASDFR